MGSFSSKVGPTERKRTSHQSQFLRSLVGTAVEMKYPMWLVPVSSFVKLSKFEPHKVMRERGELVMWEPSMKTVFFLSHRKSTITWWRPLRAAAVAVLKHEDCPVRSVGPAVAHADAERGGGEGGGR